MLRTCAVLLLLLVPSAAQAATYVLIVGVDAHAQREHRKDTFAAEARQVRAALYLRSNGPGRQVAHLPPGVFVKALFERQATRANILHGLDWLARMTPRDSAFVYISAHGGGNVKGFTLESMGAGVTDAELRARLGRLAGPSVLCLDTCQSGAALMRQNGWGLCRVITACRARETAFVGGMSPALVDALHGKADYNRNGVLEIGELRQYLVVHTPRHQPRQHPVVGGNQTVDRARLLALGR